MVYGARPDNPVPLAEDAPLGADPDGSVVGDLLEIEQLARALAAANPGMARHRGAARRAGRRGHGHADHPAFRGAPAAGGQGLRPALAVLPRGRPGVGARAGRGGRGDRERSPSAAMAGWNRSRWRRSPGCAGSNCRPGSPSAPRSGCTGPGSPRRRSPTCTTSCTRGWWTARRCGEAGWKPSVRQCRRLLRSCSSQRAGHHAAGAAAGWTAKDATITAAGATVAVIGTAAIVAPSVRRPPPQYLRRTPRITWPVWTVIRLAEMRDTPLSVDEVLTAVAGPGGGRHRPVRRRRPRPRPRPGRARLVLQRSPSAAAELRRSRRRSRPASTCTRRRRRAPGRRPRRGRSRGRGGRVQPAPRRRLRCLPGADRRAQARACRSGSTSSSSAADSEWVNTA